MKFANLDTKVEMNANDAYATANGSALYDTIAAQVESVKHNIVANKETVLMTYKNETYESPGKNMKLE